MKKLIEAIEQGEKIGINRHLIEVVNVPEKKYHWYTSHDDTIHINLPYFKGIEDIIHEYTHHVQYTWLDREVLNKDFQRPYKYQLQEFHARYMESMYQDFIDDGRLNEGAIASYYDMLAPYLEDLIVQ